MPPFADVKKPDGNNKKIMSSNHQHNKPTPHPSHKHLLAVLMRIESRLKSLEARVSDMARQPIVIYPASPIPPGIVTSPGVFPTGPTTPMPEPWVPPYTITCEHKPTLS